MNRISVPYYIVALVATLVYGLLKQWFVDLPLTQEQVQWIFVTILAVFGVDISNALKERGLLK